MQIHGLFSSRRARCNRQLLVQELVADEKRVRRRRRRSVGGSVGGVECGRTPCRGRRPLGGRSPAWFRRFPLHSRSSVQSEPKPEPEQSSGIDLRVPNELLLPMSAGCSLVSTTVAAFHEPSSRVPLLLRGVHLKNMLSDMCRGQYSSSALTRNLHQTLLRLADGGCRLCYGQLSPFGLVFFSE